MNDAQPAPPTPAVAPLLDIEQPACFYLGREFDLQAGKVLDQTLMYDARDLTTHGVVVGMTGSGKTGLCISLLEEAAIDGIPCIIIDPKGDLTNLLLQFPDLAPDDFKPWLNDDETRQKGLTPDEHARQLADTWRAGLAGSMQTPERVRRLQESSEWRIYTPGSEAGLSLNILKSFAAPPANIRAEDLNQKIDATTSALLSLAGIVADPVQSREHVFVAQLLLHAWKNEKKDIDLHELITRIQVPPVTKIGAFDVDTFYPEKERLKLAIALNNILAAPSFTTWTHGEALELARMLYDDENKPRQLIFYIAHLDDAQRMFFVTLLLEEVLSWTRKQPGTTSLRALVYFDEVFGYLPPHPANPPSKLPLMTLLKQARAFGVGVLLATQNPVDLDYKALSNAGTWFVGKLQTDRDKSRLIDGLEGVAAEQGSLSDRGYLENVISALRSRIFLLHNVHKGTPMLFQSRHALSFLRGPMTRDQVAKLMEPVKARLKGVPREPAPRTLEDSRAGLGTTVPMAIPLCRACQGELPPGAQSCPRCGAVLVTPRTQDQEFKQSLQRSGPPPVARPVPNPPDLPPELAQFYLPAPPKSKPTQEFIIYQARVVGAAEVQFLEKRRGLAHRQNYRLLTQPPGPGQPINWHVAERLQVEFVSAVPQARWSDVPESVNSPKKLKALEKTFAQFLYDSARVKFLENRALGLVSQLGEDAAAFTERCRQAARQAAERALQEERLKYQPKFEALGGRMPEPASSKGGSVLSLLNPLGWFFGSSEAAPLPRGSSKLERLEAEWLAKQSAVVEKWKRAAEDVSEIPLTPRRQDVQVIHFGLAWVPTWM